MKHQSDLTRRDFLRAGVVLGAGLTVPVSLSACSREPLPATEAAFAPDAWIRVTPDGTVTILVDRSEMGQGVRTALAMLIAEEMDADWARVHVESAPANAVYFNRAFPDNQVTGGSSSVRAAWRPLREAGARARALLVAAAAHRWGVAAERCRTEKGVVLHPESGQHAGYGELAEAAARLSAPDHVVLKDTTAFALIGHALPRLDTPAKVDGSAQFGLDVRLDGLLIATVLRCPVFGGKPVRFDASRARQVSGVREVLQIDSGVAVVADNTWAALKGREALAVTWDEGAARPLDSAALRARFREMGQGQAVIAHESGDVEGAPVGLRSVEAEYEFPFLAHATMEPQNCTADVRVGRCTIWAPTQFQTGDPMFAGGGVRGVAMRYTGLQRDQVVVHTTQLGGGFGRRLESDFVAEAVQLSKAVGAPVKVVWTREDDTQHDFYRPMSYHQLRAGLDRDGRPLVWRHRIVAPSIISRFIPPWLPRFVVRMLPPMKGGVDQGSVEGAHDQPYAVPNQRIEWVKADTPVPVGFWRSVGFSFNTFVVESFVDELASAANRDPLEFRRRLLAQSPRHLAVLERAAREAGWGTSPPKDRFRGIAVAKSFQSYVAQVAEVSVQAGSIRVHRVVCAVDCGRVVNPGIVAAQMEGAIVFGLTAALYGEITLEGGRVAQSNFHDYPMVRIGEAPTVEVHIVDSSADPTGAGEPGVPPIAPAVANAVFAATGRRIRSLPLRV